MKIYCSVFPFLGIVVKFIKQDNFSVNRPGTEFWFYAPKFGGYVKKMSISFERKDQGWGIRRGKIWVQLIKGEEMILETSKDLSGLSPHSWENVNINLIRNHCVISEFKPGDHFRFMRIIDGFYQLFTCSKFQSFGGTSRSLVT